MDRETKLQWYDEIVQEAGLERKGKNMVYTSANGHMFSQLNKANELGIRLSKEDTADFDRHYGAQPFTSYGATMREYVLIPPSLHSNVAELADWLKKGHTYVCSLPSK